MMCPTCETRATLQGNRRLWFLAHYCQADANTVQTKPVVRATCFREVAK